MRITCTRTEIIEFIEWLNREIANFMPCVLIMDFYPSHRTKGVLATAKALDIKPLFVPAGGAGRFQPIACRIVGELTSPDDYGDKEPN
jgi:hypothetical protein